MLKFSNFLKFQRYFYYLNNQIIFYLYNKKNYKNNCKKIYLFYDFTVKLYMMKFYFNFIILLKYLI